MGSMYYVSFIDDLSRKTWIYFLKTKDEIFSRYQEFKALVENQTTKKINVLRSNNGGKYTSKEFEGFYKEARINRSSWFHTTHNRMGLQSETINPS
jgi:transposase InsO family protein